MDLIEYTETSIPCAAFVSLTLCTIPWLAQRG